MNWSQLFLQKEQFSTSGYKKVEWTAGLVGVEGAKFDGGFPAGGKVTRLGKARCELESFGAFTPEARGEMRVQAEELDFWSEYSNDKVALGAGEDSVRIRLDEPSIVVEAKPEIVFEKPRGRGAFVLLGATRGERFIGYLPISLKAGGVMSFLFGGPGLMPWFIPAAAPWGGQKLVESRNLPPEMGPALADAAAWKALEEQDGKFFEPILAARMLFAALQFIRYG